MACCKAVFAWEVVVVCVARWCAPPLASTSAFFAAAGLVARQVHCPEAEEGEGGGGVTAQAGAPSLAGGRESQPLERVVP